MILIKLKPLLSLDVWQVRDTTGTFAAEKRASSLNYLVILEKEGISGSGKNTKKVQS